MTILADQVGGWHRAGGAAAAGALARACGGKGGEGPRALESGVAVEKSEKSRISVRDQASQLTHRPIWADSQGSDRAAATAPRKRPLATPTTEPEDPHTSGPDTFGVPVVPTMGGSTGITYKG